MSYEGLLNTNCNIQKQTRTQNATTGQWIEVWTSYANKVVCRLDMMTRGEERKEDDVFLRATHLLFIKYRTDINWWEYRITKGARTFNILRIAQGGGTNHHTEIILEEIK